MCFFRHANIYTAEEVTTIIRDKLIKLQSLYVEQYRHLQYLLKEKRRKYLHALKREKETCCKFDYCTICFFLLYLLNRSVIWICLFEKILLRILYWKIWGKGSPILVAQSLVASLSFIVISLCIQSLELSKCYWSINFSVILYFANS